MTKSESIVALAGRLSFVELAPCALHVGESRVPPLAPALMKALQAASGRRIRSMPLADHGLA